MPIHQEPILTTWISHVDLPDSHWLDAIGRVAPGTDLQPIQAQINVELKQWLQTRMGRMRPNQRAAIGQQHTELAPAAASTNDIGDQYGRGLMLLLYASFAVLFIACANVACLMLVWFAAPAGGAFDRFGAARPGSAAGACLHNHGGSAGGLAALAVSYAATNMMLGLAFRGRGYVPLETSPSLPVLGFAFGFP